MLASLPFYVRHLPARVADSAYWRLCRPRQTEPRYDRLFTNAVLRDAPGMRMRLDPHDHMHGIIAFTGVYERQLSAMLRERGNRGGLLVDVGANWGYFTLVWAAANPGNRVLAIEASPRNEAPLRDNVARNGLGGRVQVLAVAAGAAKGFVEFDPGPDGQTGWGGISAKRDDGSVRIKAAPLDELCAGEEKIAVLKIDVEGAEAIVLAGARRLLQERRIGEVFLELNESRMAELGIAPDEPRKILEACGYRCTPRGSDLHAVIG
jgi:FkbM family methyltransferase